MSLDLDRITHPLRLARGSHQPGSGKGCAMNVVSYINGDTKITDFPDCSARPLAQMVQSLNDNLAGVDDFLSPENSVIVLDLGWLTAGTAGTPREVVWRWLADLMIDPEMGIVRHARPDGTTAIRHLAELYMRESRGDRVTVGEWHAVRDEAEKARKAAAAAADAAAAAAAYAYADAARITFTRWAIERWRELAGLDGPADIDAVALNSALARIEA